MILALDLGGTKHTVAVHQPGEAGWRAHERVFSPPGADAQYDLETVVALGRKLTKRQPISAIGVSFGGPVDYISGTVHLSHHVPGWEGIALGSRLEDTFGVPAVVDKDTNAAALGEYRFGAGRGTSSMLFVTISTGVGGGWILDGRLWRGAGRLAGEIGHTVVEPEGPMCLCGKRGCTERLASGPFMAEDLRAGLEATGLDIPGPLTGQRVAEMAAGGHTMARLILERGARALGIAVGNAVNLINPERVILGGGVTKSGELWWQEVRQAARQTALPQIGLEIVPAALTDDAPLWGAVALVLEKDD
jgi:glucokinase